MTSAAKWEWLDDAPSWQNYDATFGDRVEKAFLTGKAVVEVAYSGTKYSVTFEENTTHTPGINAKPNMSQKNLESGKVRMIRRTMAQWFYYEDNGNAKPYGPADNAQLEAAAMAAATPVTQPDGQMTQESAFTFKMFGTDYIMDIKHMTQKNTESGKVRKITRRGGFGCLSNITYPTLKELTEGQPATKHVTVEAAGGVKKSVAATVMTMIPMPGVPVASANNDSSDDDDAGTSTAAAAKSATASAPNYGSAAKSSGAGTTTAIMKNGCVVEPQSGLQHSHHVHISGPPESLAYHATLNQTNIAQNNNKFYIIQLLAPDSGSGSFALFTRWGRVGASHAAQNLDYYGSAAQGQDAFRKKFREKTKNTFGQPFVKVAGQYQLMDIDLSAGASSSADGGASSAAAAAAAANIPIPPSALHPAIQKVMKLISNKAEMVSVMKELKIDTDKMPLGKISKKQIKEAFEHLKRIEKELNSGKTSGAIINDASSMFYTLVPHNFGFSVPPLISNKDMLKEKMKLLEVMGDLEIATKLLADSGAGAAAAVVENPIDKVFNSLNIKMVCLDHSSPVFQRVCDYVKNTHGSTHKQYKLVVEEVFAIERPGERDRYTAGYGSMPDKRLFWHGSRSTNYMGILSQGLRIAPPEAPSTGYMYGKGVYFADCSSKSANYCHTSPSNNTGFALLCEVALGNAKEYTVAQYMDKPQVGFNSTLGLGRSYPDPNGSYIETDAATLTNPAVAASPVAHVTWPLGKMVNCPKGSSSVLLYPEYIVYDVAQTVIRYMVQLRFDYSSKW